MKKITLLITLFTSLVTSAHRYRNDDCVSEYYFKESVEKSLGESCHEKEMYLTHQYRTYPKLTQNPRKVEYWEGGYEREVIKTTKHVRQLVDNCRGIIIDERIVLDREYHSIEFNMKNPNLDPTISESFMLAPLTESQAQEEMSAQKQKCQSYQL